MATTAATLGPAGPRRFPLRHPWDRNFLLTYVLLIWGGVLAGFGNDIFQRYRAGEPSFPAVVYVHAVAFVGWLVLLTVQLLLIRSRQVRLHRKIGIAGAFLAAAMVLLGIAAALTVHRIHLGKPHASAAFLSVQLLDMIEFGGLVAAAISARNQPSAHKRLILLATLSIADAGFARFLAEPLAGIFGKGIWQFWVEAFGPSWVLILGIGAYDWVTRRRLHPAYVFGALWILIGQLTACWLFFNPAWKSVATAIIRAWPF